MNLKIKEARLLYRKRGKATRFYIRLSFILFLLLLIGAVLTYFSPTVNKTYSLVFLPEQLLETARSVLGVGSIGSFLLIFIES